MIDVLSIGNASPIRASDSRKVAKSRRPPLSPPRSEGESEVAPAGGMQIFPPSPTSAVDIVAFTSYCCSTATEPTMGVQHYPQYYVSSATTSCSKQHAAQTFAAAPKAPRLYELQQGDQDEHCDADDERSMEEELEAAFAFSYSFSTDWSLANNSMMDEPSLVEEEEERQQEEAEWGGDEEDEDLLGLQYIQEQDENKCNNNRHRHHHQGREGKYGEENMPSLSTNFRGLTLQDPIAFRKSGAEQPYGQY